MTSAIKIIIGLANPGDDYAKTRHNAGAWFVEKLVQEHHLSLQSQPKCHARFAMLQHDSSHCRLFIPTTYMNHSGRAVAAIAQYFKMAPEHMLIAHDDLDLPVGTVRLKSGGGHGGHNGLRDITNALGTNHFARLRIGIDHPGSKHDVTNYVLHPPSKADKQTIDACLDEVANLLPLLLQGELQKAMHALHSSPEQKG